MTPCVRAQNTNTWRCCTPCARPTSGSPSTATGGPDAINAVREALPMMERDLFDAVLEDHACEVAAIEEALYQFALALVRGRK